MADFLVALADFDRRRAWVELGYSSLFYFLHRELGLSKGAAHYRKTAAKLVQRFPEIVEPLRDGRLCITSITHLAKVLTPQNRREMLPRFFQRSKREAMAVAAAIQPATAAPHRDVITAVRPASAAYAVSAPPLSEAAALGLSAPPLVQPVELNAPAPSLHPKPARRDAAEPLTADLSRLHITVSRRFLEKLEARIAARDTVPTRQPASGNNDPGGLALAIVSVVAGIPITAIAANQEGLLAIFICWGGLVGINLARSVSRFVGR